MCGYWILQHMILEYLDTVFFYKYLIAWILSPFTHWFSISWILSPVYNNNFTVILYNLKVTYLYWVPTIPAVHIHTAFLGICTGTEVRYSVLHFNNRYCFYGHIYAWYWTPSLNHLILYFFTLLADTVLLYSITWFCTLVLYYLILYACTL